MKDVYFFLRFLEAWNNIIFTNVCKSALYASSLAQSSKTLFIPSRILVYATTNREDFWLNPKKSHFLTSAPSKLHTDHNYEH